MEGLDNEIISAANDVMAAELRRLHAQGSQMRKLLGRAASRLSHPPGEGQLEMAVEINQWLNANGAR